MLVASICAAVVVPVLLWGLYREVPPSAAAGPDAFRGLPDPADITRQRFPVTWRGYDPAAVDSHLDRLAEAFGDLLAVAPPGVVEAARRRALARQGLASPHEAAGPRPTAPSPPVVPTRTVTPLPAPDDDHRESLRAAAALGLLRSRRPLR